MTFDMDIDAAEAWDMAGEWRDDGAVAQSYAAPPSSGLGGTGVAAVAVRAPDPARRRHLEGVLGTATEGAADVLVLDLPPGGSVPHDLGRFNGVLVVLSDDADIAGDPALAGVLPRDVGPAQMRAAVSAVAEGLRVRATPWAEPGTALPPTSAARVVRRAGRAEPSRTLGMYQRADRPRLPLTPRELDILAQVGEGLSNKAIARRLSISAHTVKFHLEAIFGKLAVRSRAEAVSIGLRHGLLTV